jgi:hypothetical protein
MKQTTTKSMVSVFCNFTDAQLDSNGEIHLIIKKDKVESSETTVRKLRGLVGSEVTLIVTPFSR